MSFPTGYTDEGQVLFTGDYINVDTPLWLANASGGTPGNIAVSSITVAPTGFEYMRSEYVPLDPLSTVVGAPIVFQTVEVPGTGKGNTALSMNISKSVPTLSPDVRFLTVSGGNGSNIAVGLTYEDIALKGVQLFGQTTLDPATSAGCLGYLTDGAVTQPNGSSAPGVKLYSQNGLSITNGSGSPLSGFLNCDNIRADGTSQLNVANVSSLNAALFTADRINISTSGYFESAIYPSAPPAETPITGIKAYGPGFDSSYIHNYQLRTTDQAWINTVNTSTLNANTANIATGNISTINVSTGTVKLNDISASLANFSTANISTLVVPPTGLIDLLTDQPGGTVFPPVRFERKAADLRGPAELRLNQNILLDTTTDVGLAVIDDGQFVPPFYGDLAVGGLGIYGADSDPGTSAGQFGNISAITTLPNPDGSIIPKAIEISTSGIKTGYINTDTLKVNQIGYFSTLSTNVANFNTISTNNINVAVNVDTNTLAAASISTTSINASQFSKAGIFQVARTGGGAPNAGIIRPGYQGTLSGTRFISNTGTEFFAGSADPDAITGIKALEITPTGDVDIPSLNISTIQFRPASGGTESVDVNLGGAVGGISGGAAAVGLAGLLGAAGLATGIAGLVLPRTDNGGPTPGVFQTVNGTSQLQVSTINLQFPTTFMTTNAFGNTNTQYGTVISTVTQVLGGKTCIRTASDPLNLATTNGSGATSTIQAYSPFVPIIPGFLDFSDDVAKRDSLLSINSRNFIKVGTGTSLTTCMTLDASTGLGSPEVPPYGGSIKLLHYDNTGSFGPAPAGAVYVRQETGPGVESDGVLYSGVNYVSNRVEAPLVSTMNVNLSTINSLPYNPGLPTGSILPWAGTQFNVPSGYLVCNGSLVSQTTYAALYAVIGNTYYQPNLQVVPGVGQFALPDLTYSMIQGACINSYECRVTGQTVTGATVWLPGGSSTNLQIYVSAVQSGVLNIGSRLLSPFNGGVGPSYRVSQLIDFNGVSGLVILSGPPTPSGPFPAGTTFIFQGAGDTDATPPSTDLYYQPGQMGLQGNQYNICANQTSQQVGQHTHGGAATANTSLAGATFPGGDGGSTGGASSVSSYTVPGGPTITTNAAMLKNPRVANMFYLIKT